MRSSKYYLDFEEICDPIVEIEIMIEDFRKNYDSKKYGKDEFIYKMNEIWEDYSLKYVKLLSYYSKYNTKWEISMQKYISEGSTINEKSRKRLLSIEEKTSQLVEKINNCSQQLDFIKDTTCILQSKYDFTSKIDKYIGRFDEIIEDYGNIQNNIKNNSKKYEKYMKKYEILPKLIT